MKLVVIRMLFLLAVAVLQVSYAEMLFSDFRFPLPILLSVVISLTLLRGFTFSWVWAVVAGMMLDALTQERLGISSFEFVAGAALFSVTARELLFRSHVGLLVLFGFGVWLFSLVFGVLRGGLVAGSLLVNKGSLMWLLPQSLMASIWSLVFSIGIFMVAFAFTRAFERYIEFFERTKVGR